MNRGDPPVSVVIPVFNGETFLAEAVASIRAQAGPPVEVVIVDDGSTDGTANLARGLGEDVRYVYQDNAGAAAARNAGLARARAGVIGFLDADDLWPAGRLAPMLEVLGRRADIDLVMGYTRRVVTPAPGAAPVDEPYPYVGSALYRRSIFDRVGGFAPTLRFGEDLDWFLRAREAGASIVLLERVTLLRRMHDRNMTRGKSLVEVGLPAVLKRALDRRRGGSTGGAVR